MATVKLLDYAAAAPEARAVFDDIMATRKTDYINNFWRALAHHPETLQRVWHDTKHIMSAGALDPLVKELVYLAVSISNNCDYCTHTHTVAAQNKGMTEAQYAEFLAVIALANQNNALANALKMPVDAVFLK